MSVENIKERIKNTSFAAFTGFAQSGKDEATKVLKLISFKRVSLADPVRQGIYNINPIVFVDDSFATLLNLTDSSTFPNQFNIDNDFKLGFIFRLQYIVENIGWDEAKKIPEVRRLLQYYGTEGGREIFGQSIWTDTADKYIRENNIKKVAVSDVRFPNELEWVRSKKNNLVIKIKRDGVGPINNHSSDLGIADKLCDIIIENNGTLEDLENKLIRE